ncbi:unnamed protein product [Chrysoparadoxa australica]
MDEVRYLRTMVEPTEPDVAHRKLEKLRKENAKLRKETLRIAALAKQEVQMHQDALSAFVTFEEEDGAIDALVMYGKSWLGRLLMKKSLRLKGHRIRVLPAPEPSTILHENYGYGYWELAWRRAGTSLIAGGLLLVSIAIALVAVNYNQQATAEAGLEDCPADWDDLGGEEQKSLIESTPGMLHCYCANKSLASLGSSSICRDYIETAIIAFWTTASASIAIVIINIGLDRVLRALAPLEHFMSVDEQELSIFYRVLFLKLLNTGLLALVTNSAVVLALLNLELEINDWFTVDWFRTQGTSLAITMIMMIATPHMYWLGSKWYKQRRLRKAKATCLSQDKLNKLTYGDNWGIAARGAEITVIFSVCFGYSSGIPILLPIGTASFFVFYWIEKYLFVNHYRNPPRYSERLASGAVQTIPFVLLLHTMAAISMYNSGKAFVNEMQQPGGPQYNAAPFLGIRPTAASKPMIATLILLLVFFGNRWLGGTLFKMLGSVWQCITCSGGVQSKKLEMNRNEVSVPYSHAVVRGLKHGLSSYSILANPKYREAFGLSEGFAYRHRRVESICQYVTEEPVGFMGDEEASQPGSGGAAAGG